MSFPLRTRRPSRRTAVRLKHSTRTISMHRCLPPARDPGFSRCFSLSQRRSASSARHTADIWRSSRFRPRGWELVPPPSSLAAPLLCFLMLGICVTRHRSRRRQETEKSASVLSEILRRHLGESEISDESMKLCPSGWTASSRSATPLQTQRIHW